MDGAYERVRAGDHEGFAAWVRLVEPALRGSLRRFARAVDVEGVIQETLARMFVIAPDRALVGENASLKLALRIAKNTALREAKRMDIFRASGDAPPEGSDDPPAPPESPPDPFLRQAIAECLKALPPKPLSAILARIRSAGALPDRALAMSLRMQPNTFLQNVVRARRALKTCLENKGVSLGGIAP